MNRLAKYTFIFLTTLVALFLAWQFRWALLLFVLSLFVAAAVRPYIAWLVKHSVPANLAQILVYLLGLSGIVGGLYVVSGLLLADLQKLSNWGTVQYEATAVMWAEGDMWQRAVVERLPPPAHLYETIAGTQGELFVQSVFGAAQTAVNLVTGLLLMTTMSIYWSSDQSSFERLWLSLLAPAQRAQARRGWRSIEEEIGSYLRSEFIQGIAAVLLLGIGYWALGLSFPVLLALLGGLAWLVPLVGGLLIAVPVLLAGLLTGWPLALMAVSYTLLILAFLEFVVEPRLFRRRRYNPMLIILTMVPLVDVLGLSGFVLAPPLAVMIQLIWKQWFQYYLQQPRETAVQLETLEQRYQDVFSIFANPMGDPYPPEIANILQRLHQLIQQAQELPQQKTASDQPS